MYGINLIEVAKILGTTIGSNVLFEKNGAVHSIYQEIIKYSNQRDIAMVKEMLQTLAQNNTQAYEEVASLLHEHFTEQELQELLAQ